jgi:hypothetical protein
MSYADRLRAHLAQKGPTHTTAKTDKTGYVGFGSTRQGPFFGEWDETPDREGVPRKAAKTDKTSIVGPGGHSVPLHPVGELFASEEEEREIRRLLGLLQCGSDHPDFAEAVIHACGMPEVAIPCLRISAELEGLL